jgi:CheY-like chemotaxis protein
MPNQLLDPICLNVLVIEDDATIREAVAEVLGYEGYEVRTARDGAEGMNMLEAIPGPTLVLLDMMMPVMNGWQFLAAQKNRTKFADISVVIVSAAPEDRALLDADGPLPVEGMLRKPIDVDMLLRVVDRYCVRRNTPLGETGIGERSA